MSLGNNGGGGRVKGWFLYSPRRAGRFSEVMHRQQDLFRQFAEHEIRSHGKVAEEVSEVRRQELFISRGEARSIVADCIQQSKKTVNYCPSCGEKLPSTK